ncbi:MAG: hypothetical protein VYC39_20440 [Myxococcota bacterium]|nr:hypothetical protein [Myxococcota bacterium]
MTQRTWQWSSIDNTTEKAQKRRLNPSVRYTQFGSENEVRPETGICNHDSDIKSKLKPQIPNGKAFGVGERHSTLTFTGEGVRFSAARAPSSDRSDNLSMRLAKQTCVIFCALAGFYTPAKVAHSFSGLKTAQLSIQQTKPGISATFGRLTAVQSEDFPVPIRIFDPLGVIQKVILTLKTPMVKDAVQFSASLDSVQSDGEQRWLALVPAKYIPKAPQTIQLSAVLLTERNGVILSMGEPEGYIVMVKTNERAIVERQALQRSQNELQIDAPFVGGLGFVGLAGTSSRLRLLVGASGDITDDWEAGVTVTVGPNFGQPTAITTESPVAVGFEAVGRRNFRTIPLIGIDSFSEPFAGVDLRLPGTDFRVGLRYGLSLPWAGIARVDISVGGGLTLFDALVDLQLGFTGGLQTIFWFADS